jgi:ribosomal protein S18 acetylase RimI-like enzyme
MLQESPALPDGQEAHETSRHARGSKLLLHSQHLAAIGVPLYMRRARREDFETIRQMIEDAKERLWELGTDQWSTDWPDESGRRRIDRVMSSIKEGKTWLAEFRSRDASLPGMIAAATVTVEDKGSATVWTPTELTVSRAVYLGRLVVAQGLAGFHIGAAITDWVGRRGAKRCDADKIRIEVWTDNKALHTYYEKRGFEYAGLAPDPDYPARQRYERDTSYDTGLGPFILDPELSSSSLGQN